jgi:hypothetical protein
MVDPGDRRDRGARGSGVRCGRAGTRRFEHRRPVIRGCCRRHYSSVMSAVISTGIAPLTL